MRAYIFPPGAWHGEHFAKSRGFTSAWKRSAAGAGATGAGVATAAGVAAGDGAATGAIAGAGGRRGLQANGAAAIIRTSATPSGVRIVTATAYGPRRARAK